LADLVQTLADRNLIKIQIKNSTMEFHLNEAFFPDLVTTAAFGVLAILLIIFGYVTFDKLTPKLDFNDLINKGNTAMAIVIGSFVLGLCYVVGKVVAAILGVA
jgi:uncharacterized membrane protein YjfL (UPF0719 family)